MNTDDFWNIIDRVHAANPDDMDAKCEGLRAELRKLGADDLKDFIHHFDTADAQACDWKLWGAAYVIHGGCSDDSFSDFRATLISMGHAFFERTLADPDSLADTQFDEEYSCYEGYQYVKNDVEKELLGAIPDSTVKYPGDPTGDSWEEDDLPELLPKLSRKYS